MQTGYENEREIDLLDILWELLVQWKPILVCAVLVAIVAAGAMYAKDLRTYRKSLNAYQASQVATSEDVEKDADKAKKALTESEVIAVESTVLNRELLHESQARLDTIIEKGLDVEEMDYIRVRYAISSDSVPVVGILALYQENIVSDEFRKQIYDADHNYDEELNEILPIVSLSYAATDEATYNTFLVVIPILEGSDKDKLGNLVTSHIEGNIYNKIEKYVPHELEYIYTFDSTDLLTAVQASITSYKNDIMSKRSTIAAAEAGFKDEQKTLYKYLLGKSEVLEDELAEEANEPSNPVEALATTTSSAAATPTAPSGPSIKYLLIGFVAGSFIYAVALVMLYMFKGRVRTLGEVTDCYAMRGLDEMHERRIDTTWKKFLYSHRVYELRYRKAVKDLGAHVGTTVKHASELAIHNGLKHVTVIPTYADTASDGLCARYADGLRTEWDAVAVPMDIAEAWTTDETRTDPGENEGLVLLLRTGDTTFKTLERIAAYCRDYSVSILGAVLLEG